MVNEVAVRQVSSEYVRLPLRHSMSAPFSYLICPPLTKYVTN